MKINFLNPRHDKKGVPALELHKLNATSRGYAVAGGGHHPFVEPMMEAEATSNQVCGMWPFSAGSGSSPNGVPLGQHIHQMATVCADPISFFMSGRTTNPSAFILGQPGVGKSSLVRRMLTILSAWGIRPLVLSDLKPDYVDLGQALGCQIIRVGPGLDTVNPLDAGPIRSVLPALSDQRKSQVIDQFTSRRINTLRGLVELVRGSAIESHEASILRTALDILDPELDSPPIIDDIIGLIVDKDPIIRSVARDRGDDERYHNRTDRILDDLSALGAKGVFGDVFSRQTTFSIDPDKGAVMDMSEINEEDNMLQAALQLCCWSYGSIVVTSAKIAASEGLQEEKVYVLVMDELWRALRASDLMVDRIDAITRLNRQLLLPQIMCTHTMKDLILSTEKATSQAMGFVERSSMVFLGGLSPNEMGNLATVFDMPITEQRMVNGWADSTNDNQGSTERHVHPEGLGKFLMKLGDKPGVPFQVALTAIESSVNDTNKRWHGVWSGKQS